MKTFIYLFLTVLTLGGLIALSTRISKAGTHSASLNLLVTNPVNGNWQDGIGASEHTFALNDTINFRLNYRNTGTEDISNLVITAHLPAELVWTGGDGEYIAADNTVDFKMGRLASTDTGNKELNFSTKVVKETGLERTIPVTLKDGNDQLATDEASLHIRATTKVLGTTSQKTVPNLPETGPTETMALTVISLFSAAGGVVLRKLA